MKTVYPDINYQLQIAFNLDLGTSVHQCIMERDANQCHVLSVKIQTN